MKKINNRRANLIYNQNATNGDCSIVVTGFLKHTLENCPSYSEKGICNRKGCTSKKHELNFPILSISCNQFNNDITNLQAAILENFPNQSQCQKCRTKLTEFQRIYGHHIFIEVSTEVSKN